MYTQYINLPSTFLFYRLMLSDASSKGMTFVPGAKDYPGSYRFEVQLSCVSPILSRPKSGNWAAKVGRRMKRDKSKGTVRSCFNFPCLLIVSSTHVHQHMCIYSMCIEYICMYGQMHIYHVIDGVIIPLPLPYHLPTTTTSHSHVIPMD